MNHWTFFTIPLISAFIGWFTIWITWKILFHPLDPKKILGFHFQGIYPRRQEQIATRLSKLVSSEFLSHLDIEKQINDPGNLKKILPLIEKHIEEFLKTRLVAEIPMLGMFIGDKTINVLKQALMKEIELLFPVVMKQFAANLKDQLDIGQLIQKKITAISPVKLESLIHENMSKELRQLRMLAAAIGFLIGLIQLLIVLL